MLSHELTLMKQKLALSGRPKLWNSKDIFVFYFNSSHICILYLSTIWLESSHYCVYVCAHVWDAWLRCMTHVCTHVSSSFLHAPSSSSSPLLLPPALVGPLLCSVLVVPEVKSLFQLFLCVYFPPSLPESVNGKFIKLFQQFLLSARGLVWNTPVFWKVLFIIVVRAGYSVGGLGILMYSRLCFSFLSFFF